MAASIRRSWSFSRFTLRALLVATFWLGSLLATYRYGIEAGREVGVRNRVKANYSQKYLVGDLLKRYPPQQLAAKFQAFSPSPWWDERAGPTAVTYRPTHGGRFRMTYYEADQSLEIYASGTMHDEIKNLLAELRGE